MPSSSVEAVAPPPVSASPCPSPPSSPPHRQHGRHHRRPRTPALPFPLVCLGLALVSTSSIWGGSVQAAQCVFTQDCARSGLDDDSCVPSLIPPGQSKAPFPMDAVHGFDESVVPLVCPQYRDSGCCSSYQNDALNQNLITLVSIFGGESGCLACAVNLVNFWCALICSPQQSDFIKPQDPAVGYRRDDINKKDNVKVLQMDVWLDPSYVCSIYNSCKSTTIVGEVTGMQSGLGLLNFQGQTGAVGYGEYFNFHFSSEEDSPAMLYKEDTLDCASFYDPGSTTIPFPYPPPKKKLTQCSCTFCLGSCSATAMDTESQPIRATDGFVWRMVLGVYAAVMVCTLALFLYRRSKRRSTGGRSTTRPALLDLDDARERLLVSSETDGGDGGGGCEGDEQNEDEDEDLPVTPSQT